MSGSNCLRRLSTALGQTRERAKNSEAAPSPAFVYVVYGRLKSTHSENAFLKVELRQLQIRGGNYFCLQSDGGCTFWKSALSVVTVEKASSDKKTSLEKHHQLAAASCSGGKALAEESSAASALENQSSNCTVPSGQEASEVDYGGGVCFKKPLV